MQKKKHQPKIVTFDCQKNQSHRRVVNDVLKALAFYLAEIRWVMAKQPDAVKQEIARLFSKCLGVKEDKLILKKEPLFSYHLSMDETKAINDKLSGLSGQFPADEVAEKISGMIKEVLLNHFNDEEVIKDFHKMSGRMLAHGLVLRKERGVDFKAILKDKRRIFDELLSSGDNYLFQCGSIIQYFNKELHKKKRADFQDKAFFENDLQNEKIDIFFIVSALLFVLTSMIAFAYPFFSMDASAVVLAWPCSFMAWLMQRATVSFNEQGYQRALNRLIPETETWLSRTFTLKKENDVNEEPVPIAASTSSKATLKSVEPTPAHVKTEENTFVPPRVERVRPASKYVKSAAPRQEEMMSETSRIAQALKAAYKKSNTEEKNVPERNVKGKRFFDLPVGEKGYLDTQALKEQGVSKEEITQLKSTIENREGHSYLPVNNLGTSGIKKIPKNKIKEFEFTDPVKKESVIPHSYIKNRNLTFRVRGSLYNTKEKSVVVYNFVAPK